MEEEKRVSSEAPEEPAKKTAEAEGAGAAQDMDALSAEMQTLRMQLEEKNDRNLRLVAEMENLRRRTERDKSEFAKYAISEFARDVLTVGDNMRRAIESAPRDAMASHPGLSSLMEGLEMTERELIKVLERFQVKRFDPLGEPFNPHLHEAMTKVDVPNVPADTVIQTIHAGYMIGDRVLRPAAVIVAKGGGVLEQPKNGAGDAVPQGAMRVPNEAAQSSRPSFRQGTGDPDHAARSGRMPPQEDWRPNPNERHDNRAGDRVAQMRRPSPRQGAGGQAGESYGGSQPNRQQHQPGQPQQGQNPNRASTLHKPVIGGGNTKPDW